MARSAPCRNLAKQTTLGVSMRIKACPFLTYGGIKITQHTLPTYEFTLDAAVAAGDEAIVLKLTNPPVGVTSVSLDVGTVLRFPGATPTAPKIRVVLAAPLAVDVTATAVTIPTLPIGSALASGAIAKDKALLYMAGVRNGVVAPTIKTEDVTDFGSGTGMEMLTLGNSKKLSAEIDLVYNDAAHDLLLSYMYDDEFIGLEAYMEVAFPHGEIHEGYALLTTATPQTNVQAKRPVTAEFQFQGGCYYYTPAPLVLV